MNEEVYTSNTSSETSEPKSNTSNVRLVLSAALPVMLGYVFLGIPCGILCQQVGLNALQVLFGCGPIYDSEYVASGISCIGYYCFGYAC